VARVIGDLVTSSAAVGELEDGKFLGGDDSDDYAVDDVNAWLDRDD
jgi:hypothetical protein